MTDINQESKMSANKSIELHGFLFKKEKEKKKHFMVKQVRRLTKFSATKLNNI